MALFDDQWLEWLQKAAGIVGTALVGAVGAAFALRRRVAKDNSDIKRERAETRVGTDLLERLQSRADHAEERLQEFIDAREKQFGACEERVRSLSEQVLDLKLANGRLQQELAKHDPAAAERLLVQQVRPVPSGPGDEPP